MSKKLSVSSYSQGMKDRVGYQALRVAAEAAYIADKPQAPRPHCIPEQQRHLLLLAVAAAKQHQAGSPRSCCIVAHVDDPPCSLSQLLHSITVVPADAVVPATARASLPH